MRRSDLRYPARDDQADLGCFPSGPPDRHQAPRSARCSIVGGQDLANDGHEAGTVAITKSDRTHRSLRCQFAAEVPGPALSRSAPRRHPPRRPPPRGQSPPRPRSPNRTQCPAAASPGPPRARSSSASLACRAYGSTRCAQSVARSPQARPDSTHPMRPTLRRGIPRHKSAARCHHATVPPIIPPHARHYNLAVHRSGHLCRCSPAGVGWRSWRDRTATSAPAPRWHRSKRSPQRPVVPARAARRWVHPCRLRRVLAGARRPPGRLAHHLGPGTGSKSDRRRRSCHVLGTTNRHTSANHEGSGARRPL